MGTEASLPGFDGKTALSGALRFGSQDALLKAWATDSGQPAPKMQSFASDSFGVVYGIDSNGKVAIFWPETGEVERLGVSKDEFYELVKKDPEGTVNLSLYQDATKKLGPLAPEEHFAFKIETALGGPLTVENVLKMKAADHMRSLGKIAREIRDIPVGERIARVRAER
jgi:hypothetical protein